jgi:hypothetical protein
MLVTGSLDNKFLQITLLDRANIARFLPIRIERPLSSSYKIH